MRRRPAALLLLATVAAALVVLLLLGASRESDRTQTLGVAVVGPVADLRAGQQACQTPVGVAETFDRITFNPGSVRRRTPAMVVTVRRAEGGRVLGSGRLRAGFDRTRAQTVRVGKVRAGEVVALCFRNLGPAPAAVFGDEPSGKFCTAVNEGDQLAQAAGCRPGAGRPTITTSAALKDGRELDGDLAAVLVREEPRSMLSRLPDAFGYASLWRPGFVGPWLYWVLLAAVALGVPALLARALRDAEGDAGEEISEAPRP